MGEVTPINGRSHVVGAGGAMRKLTERDLDRHTRELREALDQHHTLQLREQAERAHELAELDAYDVDANAPLQGAAKLAAAIIMATVAVLGLYIAWRLAQ